MILARKRWGQHFLAHSAVAERIVEEARVSLEDTVIEVGPGDGALTRPLSRRAKRLLAIEIDPLRAEALSREFRQEASVRILCADVQEKSFQQWLSSVGWRGPALFVSNLPYNAATPILLAALEERDTLSRIVATVQREVARRLTASAGDAEYGYLSVRRAAFARARILFDLPPGAFRPRPKVTSSLLELLPVRLKAAPAELRRALFLASLAFRARRKTLPNALAAEGGRAHWERALESIGKGPLSRAEELSLEDYIALARGSPDSRAETASR